MLSGKRYERNEKRRSKCVAAFALRSIIDLAKPSPAPVYIEPRGH